MTGDPALSVELSHIGKSFGGLHVLKDVSLRLEPGTLTHIAGRNGSGKSTILRILAGDLSPDRGDIILGGTRHTRLTAFESRTYGIEMVYQDLSLCEHLSVMENMFLGRELTGGSPLARLLGAPNDRMMHERGESALAQVGVQLEEASLSLDGMSGGQRQTIALCRALVMDARVLLLDEPTAALDGSARERILGVLADRIHAGVAVLVVSHDEIGGGFQAHTSLVLDNGTLHRKN